MNTKDISPIASANASVNCAACQQPNASAAKFCKGCGHALYEPCPKCVQPVLLDQSFCGGCGADLAAIVAKKQSQYDELLSNAVAATKSLEFGTAIGLLQRVAQIDDFRFRKSAESAVKALGRVEELRDKTNAATESKMAQVMAHYQAGELADVVRLLKDVPSKLLSSEMQAIYSEAAGRVETLKSLEQEFSAASREKNWIMAGELVQQLEEALPDERRYRKASSKIAEKLHAHAVQLFSVQKYSAAVKRLNAIPQRSLTDESKKLGESIRTALWLQDTIEKETYASPTLGRLAVRFAKLVPDAPEASKLVKKIAKTLKEGKRHPRCHLPRWQGSNEAWTGGEARLFTRPSKIDFDESSELIRSKIGRFSVAMGLAIQGLGKARITDELLMQKKKKSLFGKKQLQPCWGIDVGSHSLKAIRMELAAGNLRVTDFFYHEFETAIIKTGGQQNSYDQIRPAIDLLQETHDLESCLVWGNLPGSEMTTRFVRLPPVDDKKATDMIDHEISSRIPVPMDELAITKSIGQYHKDDSHGRPLVFSAARQTAVQKRMELMEQVGLKIDGMQADANAIVNLVAWEFRDEISPAEPQAEEQVAEGKKKKWGKKDVKAVARFDDKTPTICWVDAGAAATTLIYVSGETHWFWTVELGGENLTRALVRSTKQTQSEAETLKIQPENLSDPSGEFAPVEMQIDEMRSRFQKVSEDAMRQNGRFDVTDTYVSGGAVLTIGWMRRFMLRNDSPSRI